MTNREELQEKYDDALFDLLMLDFAQDQGEIYRKKAEELNEDPEAAVPEDLSAFCKQCIEDTFKKQAHRKRIVRMRATISKVAVAVLVVMTFFSGVYVSSSAIREQTKNLFLTVGDVFAQWKGEDDSGVSLNDEVPAEIVLSWLPTGYTKESSTGNRNRTTIVYIDGEGNELKVSAFAPDSLSLTVDSEDPEISMETLIGDDAGYYMEKNGVYRMTWKDSDSGFIIVATSSALRYEELLRIAQGISIGE